MSPVKFYFKANAELSGNFAVIIERLRPEYHGEIFRSSVWLSRSVAERRPDVGAVPAQLGIAESAKRSRQPFIIRYKVPDKLILTLFSGNLSLC